MNDNLPEPHRRDFAPLVCSECHNELNILGARRIGTCRDGSAYVRFKYTCEFCGSHPPLVRANRDMCVDEFPEKERRVWEAVQKEQQTNPQVSIDTLLLHSPLSPEEERENVAFLERLAAFDVDAAEEE